MGGKFLTVALAALAAAGVAGTAHAHKVRDEFMSEVHNRARWDLWGSDQSE